MTDVLAQISRAITTASNDDLSAIGSEKRARYIERIEAMQDAMAEIERLRAALKPFAEMADQVDEWQKGAGSFSGNFDANDLRRARTALEQRGDDSEQTNKKAT